MRLLIVQNNEIPPARARLSRFENTLITRITSIDIWVRGHANENIVARHYDFVLIMGSDCSLLEEQHIQWLKQERRLINEIIDHSVPCLGICFGAQHIAKVLGAEITTSAEHTVALEDIKLSEQVGILSGIDQYKALFLHKDSIVWSDPSVQKSFKSDGSISTFQHASHLWGMQSHVEITPMLLEYYCKQIAIHPDQQLEIMNDLEKNDKVIQQLADTVMNNILTTLDNRL